MKEPHKEIYNWKDKDETLASHKNDILIPE